MQKIEVDGEVFYFVNGKIVDEQFMLLNKEDTVKVSNALFKQEIDKCNLPYEYVELIKKVKESENHTLCVEFCEKAINKFKENDELIKTVLPILTSSYRLIGKPQQAIECFNSYNRRNLFSVALLTSISAAYCDIQEYNTALKFANMAYAMQGGGQGYANELSLVYRRIKKALGEQQYEEK